MKPFWRTYKTLREVGFKRRAAWKIAAAATRGEILSITLVERPEDAE